MLQCSIPICWGPVVAATASKRHSKLSFCKTSPEPNSPHHIQSTFTHQPSLPSAGAYRTPGCSRLGSPRCHAGTRFCACTTPTHAVGWPLSILRGWRALHACACSGFAIAVTQVRLVPSCWDVSGGVATAVPCVREAWVGDVTSFWRFYLRFRVLHVLEALLTSERHLCLPSPPVAHLSIRTHCKTRKFDLCDMNR